MYIQTKLHHTQLTGEEDEEEPVNIFSKLKSVQDEVAQYLDSPICPIKDKEALLVYWRNSNENMPGFSCMAKDFLAPGVSSARQTIEILRTEYSDIPPIDWPLTEEALTTFIVELQRLLSCNGYELDISGKRVRCLNHIIHLVVEDFLSGVNNEDLPTEEEGQVDKPIKKVCRRSKKRKKMPRRKIPSDVKTRWNSNQVSK